MERARGREPGQGRDHWADNPLFVKMLRAPLNGRIPHLPEASITEIEAFFEPGELRRLARHFPLTFKTVNGQDEVEIALCTYTDPATGKRYPVPVYARKGTAYSLPDDALVETGDSLAQILVNEDLLPNLIYFAHAYCFHPGSVPGGHVGYEVVPLNGSMKHCVLTVDTGEVDGVTYPGNPPAYVKGGADQWKRDVVSGHGPAIADLIADMMGDPKGAQGYSALEPLQPGASGSFEVEVPVANGGTKWVRGFDQFRLLDTLDAALFEGKHENCKVLNLSLGTPMCPHDMKLPTKWAQQGRRHPVLERLDTWLDPDGGGGEHVVISAGNHGTPVPTWPAAFAHDWGGDGPAPSRWKHRFWTVGSPVEAGRSDGDFSATGAWVRVTRPGWRIKVAHHERMVTGWTGTSFAAPQVAAELAMGLDPRSLPVGSWGVRKKITARPKPGTPRDKARDTILRGLDRIQVDIAPGRLKDVVTTQMGAFRGRVAEALQKRQK